MADLTTSSSVDTFMGSADAAEMRTNLELAAVAASGSASDLGSGTLADDRFPATLPALNGSALTNLNASNIASGTVPAANLPAPGVATLGGVLRNTGSAGEFVSGVDSDGSLLYDTPTGGGDVTGPASSVDGNFASFSGTGGKTLQDSGSSASSFATAAQGATADSALQPDGNGSQLTALNATQLTSGTVPDGRFPATLPAASGVNLTSLNAAALGSGIIPDARMPNLTGDVTTVEGAVATTLASVNSNVGSFTNANLTVNAKGLVTAAANGALVGVYRNVWVGAGAMIPRTTNGATTETNELATNDVMFDFMSFDPGTDQAVQFTWGVPDELDPDGGLKIKVYWTAASGSGNVVWEASFFRASNDDPLDTALGNTTTTTDTLTATNDLCITSALSLGFGITPTAKPIIQIQILRDADSGSDTLATNALLIGVLIQYKEVTTNPSAW
jgi:hypothetical protein